MTGGGRPPVHESLTVLDFEDVYRNEEWRKSVVKYRYDADSDHDEVAVYLWHKDESWTRKNKYVIKTREAWRTDRQIVDRLLNDAAPALTSDDVPVSEYYNVVAGETVFQSDDWWKAIVKIDQKGTYETDEAFVYLWQRSDDEWRRRQKYTIKGPDRWEEEAKIIDSVLGVAGESEDIPVGESPDGPGHAGSDGVADEFDQLSREIDAHLSEGLQ